MTDPLVFLTDEETRAVLAGRWVRVDLGQYVEIACGRTRSVLVGVARGRVLAWANACLHQPLPLDVAHHPTYTRAQRAQCLSHPFVLLRMRVTTDLACQPWRLAVVVLPQLQAVSRSGLHQVFATSFEQA